MVRHDSSPQQCGRSSSSSPGCQHSSLTFESSTCAGEIGYHRPTNQQRATAAGLKKNEEFHDDCFPSPLILPGDDLACDPQWPPQTVRSWLRQPERNKVTAEKNVIYVADYPKIPPRMQFIRAWSQPTNNENASFALPIATDITEYLAAFYRGLPVKILPDVLQFDRWNRNTSRKPAAIALNTSHESIRIATRTSPDRTFSCQLNLNDILDVALAVIPDDAYALLLLVEQDLFEEKDDDFCCGRAYGGSRVAVVSTARYNPNIDGVQNIDRIHSWPASHCETYVEDCCSELSQPVRKPQRKKEKTEIVDLSSSSSPPTSIKSNTTSSLKAAVDDFRASLTSEEHASSSWLARVCRTSSHELGHCFGMDHCIYYACVMQGTATLAEDSRQPPYLCPIDMAKVNRATGVGEKDRYQVLGAFCEKYKRTAFFAAFSAWIQERLAFLGEEQVSLLI